MAHGERDKTRTGRTVQSCWSGSSLSRQTQSWRRCLVGEIDCKVPTTRIPDGDDTTIRDDSDKRIPVSTVAIVTAPADVFARWIYVRCGVESRRRRHIRHGCEKNVSARPTAQI